MSSETTTNELVVRPTSIPTHYSRRNSYAIAIYNKTQTEAQITNLSHVFLGCHDEFMIYDPLWLVLEQRRRRMNENVLAIHKSTVALLKKGKYGDVTNNPKGIEEYST